MIEHYNCKSSISLALEKPVGIFYIFAFEYSPLKSRARYNTAPIEVFSRCSNLYSTEDPTKEIPLGSYYSCASSEIAKELYRELVQKAYELNQHALEEATAKSEEYFTKLLDSI